MIGSGVVEWALTFAGQMNGFVIGTGQVIFKDSSPRCSFTSGTGLMCLFMTTLSTGFGDEIPTLRNKYMSSTMTMEMLVILSSLFDTAEYAFLFRQAPRRG
jgi:hypothetical protein